MPRRSIHQTLQATSTHGSEEPFLSFATSCSHPTTRTLSSAAGASPSKGLRCAPTGIAGWDVDGLLSDGPGESPRFKLPARRSGFVAILLNLGCWPASRIAVSRTRERNANRRSERRRVLCYGSGSSWWIGSRDHAHCASLSPRLFCTPRACFNCRTVHSLARLWRHRRRSLCAASEGTQRSFRSCSWLRRGVRGIRHAPACAGPAREQKRDDPGCHLL